MKRIVGTIALSLCACVAAAQTPAPKAPEKAPAKASGGAMEKTAIEKALISNEMKINDAVMKGDVAAFKTLVADDGMAIDEMGVNTVASFEAMLKPGMAKVTGMTLTDFKVMWVDANTAVLTYTWTGKGTFQDMPVKSPLLSSTVYAKRGDKWLAVFHQETPKMAMPAPMKK